MCKVDGEELGRPGSRGGRAVAGAHLQKTVGRLKRYLGLAAACGSGGVSESRPPDDASCAGREEGRDDDEAVTDAAVDDDADGPAGRRRSRSGSPEEDEAAAGWRHDRRPHPTRPIQRGTRRRREPQQSAGGGEPRPRRRHEAAPAGARWSGGTSVPAAGEKISVDELALAATVVPGVRVRVAPPRRQQSRRDRPHHVTGSWPDDAHARSRANVERWLSRNDDERRPDVAGGRSSSSRRRRRRDGRARRRASDAAETDGPPTPPPPETPPYDRRFRSRDRHRGTPSAAGSAGADEAESRSLGPSLVQLVAEIVEGLELQRSRDDSSAVWSAAAASGSFSVDFLSR